MRELTCPQCGDTFTSSSEPREFTVQGFGGAVETFGFEPSCPACDAQGMEQEEADRVIKDEARWMEVCPLIYRRTDLLRLPECFSEWLKPLDPGKGLFIKGPTGWGKTRLAYSVLHICQDEGWTVDAISHVELARLGIALVSGSSEAKERARIRYKELTWVGALLIDDFGKATETPRSVEALAQLVEDRTANYRPTIWTTNGSKPWLIERLGADAGPAILRRILEFCDTVIGE